MIAGWLLLGLPAWGQLSPEIGLFFGGANYQGDLVERILPEMKETNLAYGIFGRIPLSEPLAIRGNLIFATLSGSDHNFTDPGFHQRGFRFQSRIADFSVLLEVDPLNFLRYRKLQSSQRFERRLRAYLHRFRPRITPYLLGGAALVYVERSTNYNLGGNGEALLTNDRILADKQDLPQRVRMVVPVGVGMKADFNHAFTLGLELQARHDFTDLIDGVSNAGNPNASDWYWFGGMNFTFRLER